MAPIRDIAFKMTSFDVSVSKSFWVIHRYQFMPLTKEQVSKFLLIQLAKFNVGRKRAPGVIFAGWGTLLKVHLPQWQSLNLSLPQATFLTHMRSNAGDALPSPWYTTHEKLLCISRVHLSLPLHIQRLICQHFLFSWYFQGDRSEWQVMKSPSLV